MKEWHVTTSERALLRVVLAKMRTGKPAFLRGSAERQMMEKHGYLIATENKAFHRKITERRMWFLTPKGILAAETPDPK